MHRSFALYPLPIKAKEKVQNSIMIQYTIILYCKAHVKSFAPINYSIKAKSAFCTFLKRKRSEFSIITIRSIFRNFFMNSVLNMENAVFSSSLANIQKGPFHNKESPFKYRIIWTNVSSS